MKYLLHVLVVLCSTLAILTAAHEKHRCMSLPLLRAACSLPSLASFLARLACLLIKLLLSSLFPSVKPYAELDASVVQLVVSSSLGYTFWCSSDTSGVKVMGRSPSNVHFVREWDLDAAECTGLALTNTELIVVGKCNCPNPNSGFIIRSLLEKLFDSATPKPIPELHHEALLGISAAPDKSIALLYPAKILVTSGQDNKQRNYTCTTPVAVQLHSAQLVALIRPSTVEVCELPMDDTKGTLQPKSLALAKFPNSTTVDMWDAGWYDSSLLLVAGRLDSSAFIGSFNHTEADAAKQLRLYEMPAAPGSVSLTSALVVPVEGAFFFGGSFTGDHIDVGGRRLNITAHCEQTVFVGGAALPDDAAKPLEWRTSVLYENVAYVNLALVDLAYNGSDVLALVHAARNASHQNGVGEDSLLLFIDADALSDPPPASPVPAPPPTGTPPPTTPLDGDQSVELNHVYDAISADPIEEYIADSTIVYVAGALAILAAFGGGYWLWRSNNASPKPGSEPNLHRFTQMEQQFGSAAV